MATNDRFHHNKLENTALPYISNASVIEPRPHWIAGSNNALASIRGWMERRPGFGTYTADSYASTASIVRFYTWQRWNGSFYLMMSVTDTAAVTTKVYKQKVGTDATFVEIASTPGTIDPIDFAEANNFVFFGSTGTMLKYDGTTVTNWGITPPASVPTTVNAGAGNVPAAIGHKYIYSYGVSATGYVSDVSSPSAAIVTASRTWTVSGARCTDAQCDKVHIYRTEDGGSVYLELSNSPIANPGSGTWSIADNDADASLQQSSPAPLPGVNGPVPGLLNGFRFWAGRIWGFKNDTVYFTTFEECTTSVPEECWGQPLTNSRSFGSQVLGLAKTSDFLLVFTTRGIYRISGDSLNTFSYSQLSPTLGVRNRACIAEYDDKVCWLDMSNTVQVTDGYSIAKDDLSLSIRPDIESINHALASLAAYSAGKYKWLVLCDGGASKLRVFDLSLGQWNPPWVFTGVTAVATGQVAAGSFKLFLGGFTGAANLPLVANHSDFADGGTPYIAELYSNLYSINRENPTAVSVLEYVGVERNSVALTDVKTLADEDPASGTYVSIFANEQDPPNRTAGSALIEKWYWANTPSAQRVSGYLKWAAANSKFILYALDLAYRKVN